MVNLVFWGTLSLFWGTFLSDCPPSFFLSSEDLKGSWGRG